jgi:glycine cleavage system H protein
LGMAQCVEIVRDGLTCVFPVDAYYSSDGLWVREEGNSVRIGIADHLYHCISPNLSSIEISPPGTSLQLGKPMGSFELLKADVPIPSPIGGVVAEINERLLIDVALLDDDRYGEGWLAVVGVEDFASDRQGLMSAETYGVSLAPRESQPAATAE